MNNLIRSNTVVFIFLAVQLVSAQTTAFNYQGKLTDAGSPANGAYEIELKLFDSLIEGTQIGATVTRSVTAINGVFNTPLDFGAAAFPGADRFLEISVRRTPADPFTPLNPRQQINSSPYAIQTKNAQQSDLALDSEKLGGINAIDYVTTTSVGNTFIRNDTTQQTANFNINGDGALGRLAVGLQAPRTGQQLDVNGNAQITPGGAGGSIQFGTPNAETGMSIVGTNRADIRFGGSILRLLAGPGAGTPSSQSGLSINTAGNAGLGTEPNANFRLDSFGSIRSFSNASANFVAETTGGTNTWARTYWRSPNRSWFMGTSQNFNGNQLYISDETANQTRMVITTNGFVGIGTTNPSLVSGSSNKILDVAGSFSPGIAITNTGTGGNQYFIYSGANGTPNTGHFKIYDATNVVDRFVIGNNGNVGIGTSNPTTRLDIAGTAKTGILQITGGSDLAENFEMDDEGIEPGMVVAIDSKNVGKLTLARGAYNRRVAGIVSGANNLSAGMILPDLQEGTNASPVALSGRVWVYADATKRPIQPGDLLTTSDTAGFAMKVKDHKKAQGAIIGKAMTELRGGKGFVLVLVSLQ